MAEKIIEEYITVELLGSGWAATHRVLVQEDNSEDDRYWDIQQTGVGRYQNREKAVVEAENWSKSDGIPLKL